MLLDNNLQPIRIVDVYQSLIWTDRFDECGDFELHIPVECFNIHDMQKGYYLYNSESEHTMILETIGIDADTEKATCFVVSGRSLETIPSRRIVWNQTVFKATLGSDNKTYVKPNLQKCLKQLYDENLINPAIAARKIDNFIFEESTDPRITELTLEVQYYGEDLYSITTTLCKEHNIGFKITLDESNNFRFRLHAGVDRSFDQFINPYVVFSPSYDNLRSSSYLDSDQTLKNVTLVSGEEDSTVTDPNKDDEITPRVTHVVELIGDNTGLNRREIFTDASSLSSETDDGETLTWEQYQANLRHKGIDTLMENATIKAFEGEAVPDRPFVYGEDYFIGDIVQLINEYGHEGTACISEFVWSYSESGVSAYPTFKTIQKGIYEE